MGIDAQSTKNLSTNTQYLHLHNNRLKWGGGRQLAIAWRLCETDTDQIIAINNWCDVPYVILVQRNNECMRG